MRRDEKRASRAHFLRAVALLATALLTAVGCSRPANPEEVYRSYLEHLVHGRIEEAYELLTPESRRLLAARITASSGAEPGLEAFREALGRGGRGGVLLLPEDAPDRVVGVAKRSPGLVILEVRGPDGPRHPRLEEVDGRWRVALKLPEAPR